MNNQMQDLVERVLQTVQTILPENQFIDDVNTDPEQMRFTFVVSDIYHVVGKFWFQANDFDPISDQAKKMIEIFNKSYQEAL